MQKKFIKNLGFLLFINLFVKVFWLFGIERSVQNTVGVENYGLFFSLFNFAFILNILLDLGITNYNNRNIAQNTQLLSKHFSGILVLRFALALVYIVLCLLIGILMGYSIIQFKYLIIILFNQILASLILYLRSNLQGLLLFKTDSFISVLDRCIMIFICSILLWGGVTNQEFQISWFIYAQTIAYFTTAIITFLAVYHKTNFLKLTWNWPFFIMILKQSFPFAMLTLLMACFNRIDPVLIERFLNKSGNGQIQAGIYAQAYRILDGLSMIPYLFSIVLLPMFAKMIKEKEDVQYLIKLSFSILIAPVLIVAIGTFFYRFQIMGMYKNHAMESAAVLGLLMFSFVSMSITYIFGTLLTANGDLKKLNFLALISIVVNLVFNFLLIPSLMAFGSAIASLFTQSIFALAQVILATWIFKFRINVRYILQIFVFAFGIVLLNYFSTKLSYNWLYCFGGAIILGIGWAFLTRFVNLKGIYRVLLNKQ